MPSESASKPVPFYCFAAGSALWVSLAVALGYVLALGTILLAPHVIVVDADPSRPDTFVASFFDETVGLLALVGVTVGATAAALRALAHQRDQATDHLGKLLAVTAFAFAFWAAGLRIAATAGGLLPWVLVASGVVVFVVGVFAAVRGLRARKRKHQDPAPEQQPGPTPNGDFAEAPRLNG